MTAICVLRPSTKWEGFCLTKSHTRVISRRVVRVMLTVYAALHHVSMRCGALTGVCAVGVVFFVWDNSHDWYSNKTVTYDITLEQVRNRGHALLLLLLC